jgi:hypothetical protein
MNVITHRYEDVLRDPNAALKSVFRGRPGVSLPKNITFESIPHTWKQASSPRGDGSSIVKQVTFGEHKKGYYLQKKYLQLLDDASMKRVSKDLNKGLERKVGGYQVPPPEYKWQSASNKRSNQPAQSVFRAVGSFVMKCLGWIIVATFGLVAGLTALVMFCSSQESDTSNINIRSRPRKVVNPYASSSSDRRVPRRERDHRHSKRPSEEHDATPTMEPASPLPALIPKELSEANDYSDPWVEAFDVNSGQSYFYNNSSGEAQWKQPTGQEQEQGE